jgi:hypothetical protein
MSSSLSGQAPDDVVLAPDVHRVPGAVEALGPDRPVLVSLALLSCRFGDHTRADRFRGGGLDSRGRYGAGRMAGRLGPALWGETAATAGAAEATCGAPSPPESRPRPTDRVMLQVPSLRRRRLEVFSYTVKESLRHVCEVSCRVRAGRIARPLSRLHPKDVAARPHAARAGRGPRIWFPRPCPDCLMDGHSGSFRRTGQGSAWSDRHERRAGRCTPLDLESRGSGTTVPPLR